MLVLVSPENYTHRRSLLVLVVTKSYYKIDFDAKQMTFLRYKPFKCMFSFTFARDRVN